MSCQAFNLIKTEALLFKEHMTKERCIAEMNNAALLDANREIEEMLIFARKSDDELESSNYKMAI